jgi:hypothetical protein
MGQSTKMVRDLAIPPESPPVPDDSLEIPPECCISANTHAFSCEKATDCAHVEGDGC